MNTTSNTHARNDEAQLRQLLVAQRGLIAARELDGLMDRYAADAVVGRPGARSPQKSETPRGRWM
jgi:hypothetical protein